LADPVIGADPPVEAEHVVDLGNLAAQLRRYLVIDLDALAILSHSVSDQ
jgi:hypothetical protein